MALGASLLVHAALAVFLLTRGPAPRPPAPSPLVELEVIETPKPAPSVAAEPAPSPAPSPAARPAAQPPARKKAAPAARAAAAQPSPPPPAALSAPATEGSEGIAVSDLPREPSPDLPRNGALGQGSLALGLSGSTARLLTGPDSEPSAERRPDAGPTEQELVKSRVDSIFAEARAAQRNAGAVDGAVAGLSRGFEQAARRATFAPDLQRMVDAALKQYRAEAQRFGRLGKDDSTDTWARIEDRALRGLDRSEATYVAVVELRQASDGSLVDLKLVVSSGAREFDARALGSVADGLKADATAFAKPRPEGTLSLWALMGHRQTDSEVLKAAQKVYRYALLDVVDLKPTMIDLDRGGRTEQLRFTARLLAVY
ncbi:MAG: hypothetical protein QM765_46260 [Myxococcales bacterium]